LISNSNYPKKGVTVYFREGTYSVNTGVNFGSTDSGTNDAPVVYKAYPGEKAVFNGGAEIDKTKFYRVTDTSILNRIVDTTAKSNLYYTDLPNSGITNYGVNSRHGFSLNGSEVKQPPLMLYLNGERQTLSRWPNSSFVKMKSVVSAGPVLGASDFWTRGGTYTYDFEGNRPVLWKDISDIWAEGIFGRAWEGSYNKVDSIDTTGKTIRLRYGEVSGLITTDATANYHYYENILEEIDMAGEYYLDRTNGRLYYYPPAAFFEANSKVTATAYTPYYMFNLNSADNIHFEDIYFETGRGGAFNIANSKNVLIDHCSVRNFAASGIGITKSTNVGVANSEIYNCGAKGVYIVAGDIPTLTPAECYVENSIIHSVGFYTKAYNGGIYLSGVGNRSSNNKLYDIPHTAITVVGNNMIVENNEFYDCNKEYSDMGVVYFNSGIRLEERGTIIRNNYFHDIGVKGEQFGIYCDNKTFGVTIEKNLFNRMKSPAVKLNKASYITATNNIFVDCVLPFTLNSYGGDSDYLPTWQSTFATYKNFVGTPFATQYPELLKFLSGYEYMVPNHDNFAKNLIYNKNISLSHAVGYLDQFSDVPRNKLITQDNYVTNTDPGFVSFANGNFKLNSNSQAYTSISGFDPINLDIVGIKGTVGPRN